MLPNLATSLLNTNFCYIFWWIWQLYLHRPIDSAISTITSNSSAHAGKGIKHVSRVTFNPNPYGIILSKKDHIFPWATNWRVNLSTSFYKQHNTHLSSQKAAKGLANFTKYIFNLNQRLGSHCGSHNFGKTLSLFPVCFYSRWWNDGRIKAALKQAYRLQLCHRIFPIHPLFIGVHFPIQQRPLIHENLTRMSCMRNQELYMKVGVSESPVHPADHLIL